MNKAIEEKVAWTHAAEITQASDLMELRKFDDAAVVLKNYLTEPERSRRELEKRASVNARRPQRE